MAIALSSTVGASEFNCNIKINNEDVHNTSFEVGKGEKVQFADSPSLKFSLKSMAKNRFELEAFDLVVPSRTYAIGRLKDRGDDLTYSLWTRESLIDVKCELK